MSIFCKPAVNQNIYHFRYMPYTEFSRSKTLVIGKEDAANNYARGHYTIGEKDLEIEL